MHRTEIHVRWGELDPYNHVNHATYLTYLEHARISALDSIGWGMDVLSKHGFQVVVVRADVRFRRSATAGDLLVVESGITDLRGASSTWRQTMRRAEDVILEAEISAATTTLAGRPTRTPDTFRESLDGLRWS